ncbi:MAG: hypothetical protein ACLU3I_06610 [Acutalibacteraceae bacterium]
MASGSFARKLDAGEASKRRLEFWAFRTGQRPSGT